MEVNMLTSIVVGKNLIVGTALKSFYDVIQWVAKGVGATKVNGIGTNISVFKTNYSKILNRIENGSIEIVTHGHKRYIILTENQVISLMQNAKLQNAKLQNTEMQIVKLQNVKLQNAKLQNAKLQNAETKRTVGELFANLPTLPGTRDIPRAVSLNVVDHYGLP